MNTLLAINNVVFGEKKMQFPGAILAQKYQRKRDENFEWQWIDILKKWRLRGDF